MSDKYVLKDGVLFDTEQGVPLRTFPRSLPSRITTAVSEQIVSLLTFTPHDCTACRGTGRFQFGPKAICTYCGGDGFRMVKARSG